MSWSAPARRREGGERLLAALRRRRAAPAGPGAARPRRRPRADRARRRRRGDPVWPTARAYPTTRTWPSRPPSRRAGPLGIAVEAELGRVEGDEDLAGRRRTARDRSRRGRGLRARSAGCLAVSIGNVHGRYTGAPALDSERLEALRDAGAPLALHGASGLPDADMRRAVSLGSPRSTSTPSCGRPLGALGGVGGARRGARPCGLGEPWSRRSRRRSAPARPARLGTS